MLRKATAFTILLLALALSASAQTWGDPGYVLLNYDASYIRSVPQTWEFKTGWPPPIGRWFYCTSIDAKKEVETFCLPPLAQAGDTILMPNGRKWFVLRPQE